MRTRLANAILLALCAGGFAAGQAPKTTQPIQPAAAPAPASTKPEKVTSVEGITGDVRYTATPDEEIADVKAATLEDAKKFYADFYGASVGELAVVGRTLQFDAELEKKVRQLTAEQLVSALRKHIDPAKISIVKAGDFAKAAAAPPAGK
jgi:hypothetical protein